MNDSQPAPEGQSSAEPMRQDAATAYAPRTRLVLSTMFVLYVAALAWLIATDHVTIIWKTLVVPSLALAAALTGKLRAFVRDWAVFLGAVIVFDAGRGVVYGLVMHFGLPVYMSYAIRAERAIFGDPLLTVQIQSLLTPSGHVGVVDKVLAAAYGSHFLLFLFYGLVVWLTRERSFGRYKAAMMLVMYGGLLGYLLVPTVPPWMAAHQYYVIDGIQEFGADLFHGSLPNMTAAFEVNPIAAMPSLHCAFPTLLTLMTFEFFGLWGLAMGAYASIVFLSTVHLGHHYGVDVLGGIALGALAYVLVFRSDRVANWLGTLRVPRSDWAALRVRVLVTILMVIATHASGYLAYALVGRDDPPPSEEFVTRELDGKSPMANYYHGLHQFKLGQFRAAQPLLEKALFEVPEQAARASAAGALAASAYRNGDYPTVVAASAHLNGMPGGLALYVGEALVRTGREREGFRLIEAVSANHPGDPEVAAFAARLAAFRRLR
jgi:membrane-associated phospholipid phosphatase